MTATKLTPAARKLLANAAANGGTYHRPTYGPMTQLVDAGLATTTRVLGDVVLTLTRKGRLEANTEPHTENGEWCKCSFCVDPLSL